MTGELTSRVLPDGRRLYVEPLLLGRARLCVQRPIDIADGWSEAW